MLTLKSLLKQIEKGTIHTVNIGFPDHYGRLMGKKIDGQFFSDEIHEKGTHACNYLLACDLVQDVPNEVANWSSGYGDYHLLGDNSSIRKHWLDG